MICVPGIWFSFTLKNYCTHKCLMEVISMKKLLLFILISLSLVSEYSLYGAGKRTRQSKPRKAKKAALYCSVCNSGPFDDVDLLHEHSCNQVNLTEQDSMEIANESATLHTAEEFYSDATVCSSGQGLAKKPCDKSTKKYICTHPNCQNISYAKKSNYDDHILRHHHICPVCDATVIGNLTGQALLRKLARHLVDDCKKKAVYVCNQYKHGKECLFISLYKTTAEEHARSHSRILNKIIDVEEEYCISSVSQSQSNVRSRDVIEKCPIVSCTKNIRKGRIDDHLIKVHSACPWCEIDATFESLSDLVDHLKTAHVDQAHEVHFCQKCTSFVALNECEFKKHEKICKGIVREKKSLENTKAVPVTKKGSMDCPIDMCDSSFRSQAQKDQHIISIHYACPNCDYSLNESEVSRQKLIELANHIVNTPGHTKRDVYVCNQPDCLRIDLKWREASKHAGQRHKKQGLDPECHFQKQLMICPFKDFCFDAQISKDFHKQTALMKHISLHHIECPYGETFNNCSSWEPIRNQIVELYRTQGSLDDKEKMQLNKDLFRNLEKHIKQEHPDKLIRLCSSCENFIAIFESDFKKHSCSGNKKNMKKSQIIQSSKGIALLSSCEEQACTEESFVSPLVLPAEAEQSAIVLDDPVSDDYEQSVFCWLKSRTATFDEQAGKINLGTKGCWEQYHTRKDFEYHVKNSHLSCFTCFQKNCLFKSVEDLLQHQSEEHSGEVTLRSKCPVYQDKKVCIYCCKKYQYTSKEALRNHKTQQHAAE